MRGPQRLTKKDLFKRINVARIGSAVQATEVLGCAGKVLKRDFNNLLTETVTPLFFRNGTITMETKSSIIANELRMKEDKLKFAINQELGRNIVKHFLWRVSG